MEEDNISPDSVNMIAVKDTNGDLGTDKAAGGLITYVEGRFSKAETARDTEERRWIKAYQNYRGLYGPNVKFTDTEKSRIFVKVTKTKVLAAFGQMTEVLFGGNKFPITIDPTTLPDGVLDTVHIETNDKVKEAEKSAGIQPLLPGETMQTFRERLGGLKKELEPIEEVKPGPGVTPSQVTFEPAMVAAKKMEKKIHDQLEESHAKKHLRAAAFECSLFGTGIMKGPFAVDKEYPRWDDTGKYDPLIKTVPMVSSVSIWNFYPDPDANSMEEAEYVIERHKMSRSELRKLSARPYFRKNEIEAAIKFGPNYTKEWW